MHTRLGYGSFDSYVEQLFGKAFGSVKERLRVAEGLEALQEEGRAGYQIALTVCPECERGQQQGGGEMIDVGSEIVEMAQCDAQHIGDPTSDNPPRASQTIPPATRRQVMRRDHGQCVVPGCCNSVFVDVHHLKLRSEGVNHDPDLLAVTCGTHHRALHLKRVRNLVDSW